MRTKRCGERVRALSRSVITVPGKKPKRAKMFWYCAPKKQRDTARAAAKRQRKENKQANIERRDAAAKHKMALKRRAAIKAKKDPSVFRDLVGQVCLTPVEPRGRVRVDRVAYSEHYQRVMAEVVFIGNHPAGYKDGSLSLYAAEELTPERYAP